jgi:Uma2 family endonuclease
MIAEAPPRLLTPAEYLALERASECKSEYVNGEMRAMTGASRRHNLIVTNILASLHQQLRKRNCEVYPSDMRVKVPSTGRYTYPDIIVVCGKPQFEDQYRDTLLNPMLIVEVLSDSTESYDRGDKFENFRTIASLSDYLLVAQHRIHVEHYVRQTGDTWLLSDYNRPDQVVDIQNWQCQLLLEDVYEKIEFETDDTIPSNGSGRGR